MKLQIVNCGSRGKLPRPIKKVLKTAHREFYAWFGTLKPKFWSGRTN